MNVCAERGLLLFLLTGCGAAAAPAPTSPNDASAASGALAVAEKRISKVHIGRKIFFDTNLSEPAGEACSTCHDPFFAYADGRDSPTSEGATVGRYGFRNTPSIVYASFTPQLSAAGNETGYSGGLFWDGRAATLQAQASGPLLNPLEMNNADQMAVVAKIQNSAYADELVQVYGAGVFDDTLTAMSDITDAVAAFETSTFTDRFTSKYDAYLAGTATLSDSEAHGLQLFEDKKKGNCASCHLDKPDARGNPPLFTDFGYDNLGIPKNPANPYYSLPPDLNPSGADFVDYGLGQSIAVPGQLGKFKAPSLRNIALTAPYGHNGYFADLHAIVDFYNTRDVAGHWPAPEWSAGMNTTDMGNLGLSADDEEDLVAFMKTLTDGY